MLDPAFVPVFAALPTRLVAPATADVLLLLASLTVCGVLWFQRGQRGAPHRSLFLLLAGFAVACAAGDAMVVLSGVPVADGVHGPVKLAVAALAWCAVLLLAWRLPQAVSAQRHDWEEDLSRLRLLEAAVAASGDGIVVAESGGTGVRIVYANPAFERMTGYGGDEAIGLSPSILADDAEPAARDEVRAALRGTQPVRLEVPGRRKDRSRIWTEWHVVPVADGTGRVTHTVAVLRDTTERRRGELALRESEARFRGLFEHAADAIFILHTDGRIVDVNRRACSSLGYTRDELKTMKMSDLGAGARVVDVQPGDTITSDHWYQKKDGTVFPVEVRFALLETGTGRLKLALVRDATRRRQAEQTLRDREELLRNVIAHIPCAVFWKDRNSVYLGCNDQVARDHGAVSADQMIGKTDYDFGVTTAEAAFYRDCDQKVIETEQPIADLEEFQTRRDGTVATLLTSKVPLRDSAGRVIGVLGVYQDVTNRKRMEAQIRQTGKMEAIGRLAGGIAHDFNNLLTIIRGNADLLMMPAPWAGHPPELLDDLRLAADRAAALVRQLMVFGRRQPTRPEVVDLNEVVSGLAGMLDRLLGEKIAVATRPAGGPVIARADHSHLEQIVMNLAVNARDAMPDGGTLVIGTEAVEGFGGRFARLIVSDTGTGMTDEVKAKIFEPFFTTKGPDKGTGLGLATVFGIVQQAGGQIAVESARGVGTTFRVDLPWCNEAPDCIVRTPLASALPDRSTGRTGGVVLLVEDEDAVRKLARITLEGRGYAVTDAPDGKTALARLELDFAPDVLVTDMTMPGIDGGELAVRVRAARPDIGVVIISGYIPDAGRIDDVHGAIFLPKPFTPSDLLRAVSKARVRVVPAVPGSAPVECVAG